MAHFLSHLGPAVEGWWRDLGTPTLTPETCERLVAGVAAEMAGESGADIAHRRDRLLLALVRILHGDRVDAN